MMYLFIGEWRVSENISIPQASGQYRPTDHQYKMSITNDIVITCSDCNVGSHFLSLANYEEISNRNGTLKPNFLLGNSLFLHSIWLYLFVILVKFCINRNLKVIGINIFHFSLLADVMGKVHDVGQVQSVQVLRQDQKKFNSFTWHTVIWIQWDLINYMLTLYTLEQDSNKITSKLCRRK